MGLFAQRPYEELSMDGIAEACGVSRALLYHHFGDKRRLYVATIAAAAGRLTAPDEEAGAGAASVEGAAGGESAAGGGPPDAAADPAEDELRTGLRHYFATVEKAPEVHAAFRRAAATDPEIAGIVAATREGFAARVVEAIEGGPESPLAWAAARAWVAAVEAAAADWISRRAPATDDLIEVLVAALEASIDAVRAQDPTVGG